MDKIISAYHTINCDIRKTGPYKCTCGFDEFIQIIQKKANRDNELKDFIKMATAQCMPSMLSEFKHEYDQQVYKHNISHIINISKELFNQLDKLNK